MHDKLYGYFVGHTKQDQKLGIKSTLMQFRMAFWYVFLKTQNETKTVWTLRYRWILEKGWEIISNERI